jgi:ABC-type glycerol-3-phosphate transport system substrate-binding protein
MPNRPHRTNKKLSGLAATAALLATLGGTSAPASASTKVTLTLQLQPNTGSISSSDNSVIASLTSQYEKAHPNVTVNWLPVTTTSITTANATLVSQASGGDAPDVVWEQYNPLLSGSIPAGVLQNLKPWLEKPDPYVPGNKKWLSLFAKSLLPYMTSPNGQMQILLGSNVETGMFYNKADFAKAGIKSAPATWNVFMADLAKLKKAGITPFFYAYGGLCNPSWYERLASTELLHGVLSKFMVDHSQVTSGTDVVSGIEKGIISMKDPRYAEVWKLLAALKPYMAGGGSSYDACSNPNTTTPPLSPQPGFVQGKYAIVWGGTWFIPQLGAAGFQGKYGIFPEPMITKATTPFSSDVSTVGVIGGPNGTGQWSVTSQKADHSMTPAKTAVVMNFLAWLFTPKHLGAFVNNANLGDIPTEPAAPTPSIPGMSSLVPKTNPPTVVDIALDDVLTTNTTNTGLRDLTEFLDNGESFTSFASQWDSNLQQGAVAYAAQNHLKLSSYK